MARIRIAVGTLECRPELDPYRQDTGEQTDACLWLNPMSRACGIEQRSGAPGAGTPVEEYTGHRLTHGVRDYASPSQYPEELATRRYLRSREGQALLRRVCDGWDSEWDGNNHIGQLTADARQAWDALCSAIDGLTEEASYADAADWYSSVGARECGITARTSDARLAVLAARFDREAWAEGRVVVGGSLERLTEMRDELRASADE